MVRTERISVSNLCVDAVQSREDPWVGDDRDRQLAASIAQTGLLQDILVRPVERMSTDHMPGDADYAIIAGSRRYFAAMEAGRERLRCKVLDATDLQAAWQSLAENTTRRDLSEQEIARQLRLIYEMVRPRTELTACPTCHTTVDGETGLMSHCQQTDCHLPSEELVEEITESLSLGLPDDRFETDRAALVYLSEGFLGRSDENARSVVRGHLRTAELPPLLQALFKEPAERTAAETTALKNHNIDTTEPLGSGEGKSGTSREVVSLHKTIDDEIETDALDPTDAVLRAVGSLQFEEMSEQELRRTLRSFRKDISAEADVDQSVETQRQLFTETLQQRSAELREMYQQLEPARPFKKVDVLGPDSEQHSRWHAQVMQRRDASGHGELVRDLYQERLETLAEQQGWN